MNSRELARRLGRYESKGRDRRALPGEFSHRDPLTAARLTAMREKNWTFIGRHAGGVQWRILWLAHTKYIVGVSGLVRNSAGQVLLIKGRMWKPSRPWGLVTGYYERLVRFHQHPDRTLKLSETHPTLTFQTLATVLPGFGDREVFGAIPQRCLQSRDVTLVRGRRFFDQQLGYGDLLADTHRQLPAGRAPGNLRCRP